MEGFAIPSKEKVMGMVLCVVMTTSGGDHAL